jgi:hypothetical protein
MSRLQLLLRKSSSEIHEVMEETGRAVPQGGSGKKVASRNRREVFPLSEARKSDVRFLK